MAKKVEYFKWSPSYSIGIRVIDEQHMKLMEFVNELFNYSNHRKPEDRGYIYYVIQQAVDYIKVHFITEEKYMTATEYPDFAKHKKEHDTFILNVVKTAKDFEAGKRLVLTNFAYFLKDWVLSHIAVSDRDFSNYCKTVATRKADGKLTITLEDVINKSII